MTTLTLSLIILIAIGLVAAYLYQPVKRAAVKPVIGGKFPVEVFSEKRRYEVIWDETKFVIGLTLGAVGAWVVRGWL